ncbi:4a-hydroxytetrahydrobiopterin dehydratase [Epibacterium ulvae]|uniref:4a-hydroxytetrahydrobiopterin dehydratase n=1 Tax=Epibacterium ulvae TaxID=1156985 RepID=UPI001BFC4B6F|nr:4a-hydroxytetrahydrobiopterin dehydratase [Epibacterium ulvae]MBT8154174.1 4a-hydroxytetrahydrobiopterin dehydratase [Epibacterium ulvae]
MTATPTLRCGADTPRLTTAEIDTHLRESLPEWVFLDGENALMRRVETKGFAKPVYLTNLATFLADQSGHHPDLRLGWGYFEIRYTTHDAGGITAVDIACAQRFDAVLDAT